MKLNPGQLQQLWKPLVRKSNWEKWTEFKIAQKKLSILRWAKINSNSLKMVKETYLLKEMFIRANSTTWVMSKIQHRLRTLQEEEYCRLKWDFLQDSNRWVHFILRLSEGHFHMVNLLMPNPWFSNEMAVNCKQFLTRLRNFRKPIA